MKKGSIVDIIGAVTLVFFFSISAILGWFILDQFQSSAGVVASGMNTTYIDQAKTAQEVWDWGILFILFGSMLFALITAYMVDTHPALFVFGIIVFMITLVVTMIVSNAFYAFYNTADLATSVAEYPNLIYVMNHLVEIMMVYGFIMLIVVYAKLRYAGGGGI
jgi:hypothetical protein